jgi:diaminopimelate decarboxylase
VLEPPAPPAGAGVVLRSADQVGRGQRGDLVAIGHAGAYGSAMASTYNGWPRPPEVMFEPDGTYKVLRRRGTIASLR